eukprot:GFUD01003014.1.p1 GENE.GFUD01003014.1~~GFUD01003014.1.p1  ORF type:complete len:395 (+),score=136.57 GFUD01003014.1:66-1250(+)
MEKSKKKNSQPGKINFIERNRLLASKKKTAESEKGKNSTKPTIPPDAPLNPNRPKTAGAVSRNPSVAPSKENLRPISAPTATKSKISLKRRNTSDKDLVSKMIDRNLYEPLLRIFLSLSSTTLTACREVCTSWYSYTKLVFWKQIRVRRELEERLAEHWLNKKLHKVELKVGGLACKKKCVENFRECPCKDKLDCAMNGNSLVVEFGGDSFYGEYVTNDKKVDIEREKFDIEQFQLNFHLKLDLKLEISNWLNTAVHIKKKPLKLKLEFDSMTIERHPADPTYLMIKDKDTMELKHKFQPYTKTASKKPIDGLLYSCGRLAVLTGGQVFVYCTNTLARGNNGGALRLAANRDKDPEVHFMFLNENVLVTVGGCKVTMYDFWRFTWTPAIKDFQT